MSGNGRLPYYRLVCQAPHPDPRRAANREIHGLEISASTVPVRPTGRLLNWLDGVRTDGRRYQTPTCGKCGLASEYVECSEEEAGAG